MKKLLRLKELEFQNNKKIGGYKNYTEARVLGQMFSMMIEEKTDYTTTVTELGRTSIAFEALKSAKTVAENILREKGLIK